MVISNIKEGVLDVIEGLNETVGYLDKIAPVNRDIDPVNSAHAMKCLRIIHQQIDLFKYHIKEGLL